MREILFRGFHPYDGPDTILVDGEKVKGRWVKGNLVHAQEDESFIPVTYIFPDFVTAKYNPTTKEIIMHGGVDVLPSTVGQYTGIDSIYVSLNAPAGSQKIFTGDVLCGIKKEEIGVVTYWELYGGYVLVGKNGLPNDFTHKLIANAGNWGHLFNRGTVFDVDESVD